MNFHVDHIFSTAEPFVTKPGMVMHYYGPEFNAEKISLLSQGQGHCEGSYNLTVYTISIELLLFLQPIVTG